MRIEGFIAPGYEAVVDEFERNFTERGEVGAAFAAVHDGRVVVDLWGGLADKQSGRPWEEDTLQVIFSGTKGLVAVCLLMLIDRGQLDPAAPVCRYWPEFAAAGKEHITVAEIASHQARLPGIRTPLAEGDILDDVRMAQLLAAQAPETDPRAANVYHALTYGWLCGELIRRIDGRSVGRFFAEEVAGPLGLEIWIGLPEELEHRVSTLSYGPHWGRSSFTDSELADDPLLSCVWANPVVFPEGRMPWNSRAFHAAELPASGAIGTARSMAKLYERLVGEGASLLTRATVELGRRCLTRRQDPLIDELMAFSIGFELQTELGTFGPPPTGCGHTGAGGSVHGAWPDERVGFSYCMNEMRDDQDVDPRAQALLSALYEAIQANASALAPT